MFFSKYNSPVGLLIIVTNESSLCGLYKDGQKYFLDSINEELIENNELEIIRITKKWLDDYFFKRNPSTDSIPLKPNGNDFRQLVWSILKTIPYGKTTTYGEIAKEVAHQLGKENMSAQAIGNAIGHNPISIIIPCHRVIAKNGTLTGYAGGINMKKFLLELEKDA